MIEWMDYALTSFDDSVNEIISWDQTNVVFIHLPEQICQT